MRKIFIYPVAIIALLALYQAPSSAQQENTGFFDKFTFGIEGSYISSVFVYRHFNFISSYGYRIDHKYSDTGYRNNGEFLIHFGLNASRHINLSLYTGYSGVYRLKTTYPVTLRVTGLFGNDPMRGRWLVFAGAGPGFSDAGDRISLSGIWKAGGGYRVALSRFSKLDFLMSVRTVMSDNGVSDPENASAVYIPEENLRRNDAIYLALTFGIGITF